MSADESVKNTLTAIANLTDNEFILEMVDFCIDNVDGIKKEQDRDTRHACAEAVQALEIDNRSSGHMINGFIHCKGLAHKTCINTRAL
jgi:hypothetical protein